MRITNLATGKWLSFEREIARDGHWYVIRNGTTLVVPPAKLRVEAFHGLTTDVAVRELDLTGRDAASQDPLRSSTTRRPEVFDRATRTCI